MYKKIFSAILFGVLTIASTSTFVSCKDYDDDINNLQAQIDELNNKKIAEINSTITELKNADAALQKAITDGDAATLAAAKTLIAEAIADCQKACKENLAKSQAEQDAKYDEAIAKVNQRVDDVLKLLSDQDGNIQEVGKQLQALSNKLSAFETEFGTLSEAFRNLKKQVTNLDDAVKAQKAEFDKKLEDLAKTIGTGTGSNGYDDASLKADIKAAGTRIDALEQSVKDLEKKLTDMLNDEIKKVNDQIKTINSTIDDLRAAHSTFATKDELNALTEEVAGVKSKALENADNITVLQTLVKILASDLRSLVFMPKLYVDGIETIEYPYLKYALLHKAPNRTLQRLENDLNIVTYPTGAPLTGEIYDLYDVTVNDSVAYGPAWPVQYHMNPGNANTVFADIVTPYGWYAWESEVTTRAFYDTKQNAAGTYGFTPRQYWDNQYDLTDEIWSTTNGIMTVGLQIKDIEKIDNPGVAAGNNHFPSDLKEDQNYPRSVHNIIAALQAHTDEEVAGNAGDDQKNIVTSDYAQILPEKVKIEAIIWYKGKTPTYWDKDNNRTLDFWENKKGYGPHTELAPTVHPTPGLPCTYAPKNPAGWDYGYREGKQNNVMGRDTICPITRDWIHVWKTPEEALMHPADIELYVSDRSGVNIVEHLGVHWYYEQNAPLTDNVYNNRGIKTWYYNDKELQRYGFVWVFDTLDYVVDVNGTHDSRYITIRDHHKGTIVAENVKEDGVTYADETHTAVDREPLVRVRLYHFSNIKDMERWKNLDKVAHEIDKFNADNISSTASSKYAPVLDGYIRVHITRPELLEVTEYEGCWPTINWTPNECNDKATGWTTWAQFSKWVLRDELKSYEKEGFDAAYIPELETGYDLLTRREVEMVQYTKPRATQPDNHNEYYGYKKMAAAPANWMPTKDNKDQYKIGKIWTRVDEVGTTNHVYRWTITQPELEALTHHATAPTADKGETPITITRYVHYTGHFYNSDRDNNRAAPYDDIFIKLTITIKRGDIPTSITSKRDENNWYNMEGSWLPAYDKNHVLRSPIENYLQSIANNTPYPTDGLANASRTVKWRNNMLYTWDGDKIKITNAGASKFYFAPFEYELTVRNFDGSTTKYTVTPRRGSGDQVWDKFICKWWNEKHQYQLDKNNPFNSAKLEENNKILNSCAIAYQPSIEGIKANYNMDVATIGDPSAWPKADGVFSNDTLYAIESSKYSSAAEYEPIAIIVNNETDLSTDNNYDRDNLNPSHETGEFELRDGAGQVILLHEYVENKWLPTDVQPSGALWREADTEPDIWKKENKYAEACVNAVGYITEVERQTINGAEKMTGNFTDKGNPLSKQLRGYVGLIASQKCNIANQMNDQRTKNFAVFQMAWERPINILKEADFMVDAINNGDFIYLVDIIKLFDWRGASNKSEGDPTLDTGYMWGATGIPAHWTNRNWRPNQWLWAYYNVRELKVDLRTNKVLTDHSHIGEFKPISDPENANAIQLTAKGTRNVVTFGWNPLNPNGDDLSPYDDQTRLGFGANKYYPLRTSPRDYNAVTENEELIEYMGLKHSRQELFDPVKGKFGYIRYENNGQNVHDFTVLVPVSVVYDWGEVLPGDNADPSDKYPQYIKIHIKHTRGND